MLVALRASDRRYASVGISEVLEARTLLTTVLIDYSLDTNNFFDTQEKMDLLQSAADSLASRLTDSLTAIEPGPSGFGFDNSWTATFSHPGTGSGHMITDMTVAADTLVVFAGGRGLGGSTVGFGGPGGYGSSGTQEFLDNVASRGQSGALDMPATDFGPWGGAITFDTGTNWFFGTTTTGLDGSETDFLSVAEHELAHLLGFGTADSWDTYVSGSSFNGAASVAEFGSNVPLNGGLSHWTSGTMSEGRPATMTPSLLNGTRGLFTDLDFAGLDDIGWDVSASAAEIDYGDAPDTGAGTGTGNYQTLASDNGVSHVIVPGLFLGASVDGDAGTLQNDRANADDVDSALPDDEDGVLNSLELRATTGTTPSVTLLATNTTGQHATLVGWIDYNRNGNFENGTERALLTVPDGTTDGRFTLAFPEVPADAAGTTYARFRLSTDSIVLDDFRMAPDGEVEDYAFAITTPSDGRVKQTVEIDGGTSNGPALNSDDDFGRSLALLGDLDGDGVLDLAVGADKDDGTGTARGAVHLLLMNADGSVKQTIEINDSTPNGPVLADYNWFGSSVAAFGDLDGDGVPDLAVGARGDHADGIFRGAVYLLFLNSDGSVKQTVKIDGSTPNGPTLSDRDYFGVDVTALGDLDGDGVTDLAVGAFRNDADGTDRGTVFLLLLNPDGSLKQSTEINSSTPNGPMLDDYDEFGSSVATLGDLDGDGVSELAVGAIGDDEGGDHRGAVHILFLNSDGSVKQTAEINSSTPNGPVLRTFDLFGCSVAALGDLDGDGVNDLAVGAFGEDNVSWDHGAVHLLLLNSDGSVKQTVKINGATPNGPTLDAFDGFGRGLTSLGDLNGDGISDLAVGAYGDDAPQLLTGTVHVLFLDVQPLPVDVTLPGAGSYEVLRDGADLVVRVEGGSELSRDEAADVSVLRIAGSAADDAVTVLDSGTAVDKPIVFTGGDGNDRFDASLATGVVNLTGNGGDDVLIGGVANDTLNGGSGKDELVGNAGDDLVQGQGGTGDTLDGGDGDDTLNGGSGNDLVRETFAGDATLTNSGMSGRGSDVIIAAERAELSGGAAGQTIDVSAFFTAGLTSVTLDGAGGDDVLLGSDGSDVLVGSGGSDRIEGNAGGDRMIGGSGADTLIGGAGDDRLKGLGGSGDRLSGGEGDDTLNGGRGIDRVIESGDVDFTLTNTSLTGLGTDVVQAIEVAELSGGASANTIDVSAFLGFRGFTLVRGNGGDDSIIGSAGTDVLNGGDGDDSLVGNEGNDLLNGDGGNDTLLGKEGNDTLNGGDGNDGLSGFTGDDELNGERGFDRAYGGQGNDTLTGGNAVDTLIGGDGDDSIAGNDGTDTLVGGTGNNDASPGDVITDATANIDEAFTLDPLPAWVDQV